MLFFVPILVADLDGGGAGIRPKNLCRKVPIVLPGDSDFPVRMHQEPFVHPDSLGELTVFPNASS